MLAIIAVITSALFPVFFMARNAAKASVCISNYKQAYLATNLYLNDYDDTYMPVNHQPDAPEEDQNSGSDRTWVQLVLPYANDFGIFRCPADDNDRPRREASFDQDLVPGDTYSQFYTASKRTNLGFNFVYFSPIYQFGETWLAQPKRTDDVERPGETFMFIDSVWTVDSNGQPTGGGSWLVVPPCRYDANLDDTFKTDPNISGVYTKGTVGWEVGQLSSPMRYGYTYPWHSGRMTTVTADGSARTLSPKQIVDGCDVQPNWAGKIKDSEKYRWDLR